MQPANRQGESHNMVIARPRYSRHVAEPDFPPRKERASWKLWAAGVALIILIVFVVQNSQEVEVDFLFTTTTTPLIFALLIAGVLGAAIGWLAPRVRRGGRD
jgi:uncharacterized integral membrane protein